MSTKKQSTEKEEFNIKKELEFWNSYNYSEDSESKLVEQFKKIRSEKISQEDAKIIANNMMRIIPENKQPVFFLKIYVELPKKGCDISKELLGIIKEVCITVFEKSNLEAEYYNFIGKEICSADKPEKIVSEFIGKIQSSIDKEKYSSVDPLAIAYIWMVQRCKEYRIFECWKTIIIIEKVFVELLRSDKERDIENCTMKSVPKAIANKSYKKQFLSSSYLYMETQERLIKLEERNVSLQHAAEVLKSENGAQVEKIKILDKKNSELEAEISSKNDECDQLKTELVLKENMLKFEKNRFEQQYIGKEKNLMSEVESVIGLEIEGIEGIADRLPEKERERILRYIRRIKDRIRELGGQE